MINDIINMAWFSHRARVLIFSALYILPNIMGSRKIASLPLETSSIPAALVIAVVALTIDWGTLRMVRFGRRDQGLEDVNVADADSVPVENNSD